jgi:hypothetical protein
MTTKNNCFYLQNRLIQTSQTGGQQYIDTSPSSIPWSKYKERSLAQDKSNLFLIFILKNIIKIITRLTMKIMKNALIDQS